MRACVHVHVCACVVSAAVRERACGADEDCMSGADEDCMSGDRLVRGLCTRTQHY